MRRFTAMTLAALLAVACAGGSTKSRTATPDLVPTGTTASATWAAILAATPYSTTAEDAAIEQTVRACMTPALPGDGASAASRFDECLNRAEGGYTVAGVSGAMPIVLIERAANPTLCRSDDFIAWRSGEGWRLQYATPLLPGGTDDSLLGARVAGPGASPMQPPEIARQATDGLVLLTLLANHLICGSGPAILPMLFALNGDTWQLAWESMGLNRLTDPRSDFVDASGIEHVHVRGALWATDPADTIFAESHAGPHRYVDETWTRDGQRYVLSTSTTEPSAYDTLVNLVYRLSTPDDVAASKLVTDAALLDTAKRVGMVQKPLGQQWMTNLDVDTECCGPIRIAARAPDHAGPPRPVVVTFVQRGGDWLISGIAAE